MDEFWKWVINQDQTIKLEEHNGMLLLILIFQTQEI